MCRSKAEGGRRCPGTGGHAAGARGGSPLESAAAFASISVTRADFTDVDPEIRTALYEYSGGEYNWVNPRLRGTPLPAHTPQGDVDRADQHIAAIRKGFCEAPPLKAPIKVWRGVSDAEGVFGAVGSMVGETFTERAFVSSSTERSKAVPFSGGMVVDGAPTGAMAQITVPAGAKAVAMDRHECEVLLPDGARFAVVADDVVDGHRSVHLEYLLAAPG